MRKRKFRDDEISLDRSHLDTKARTRALSGRSHFVVQSLSCSQFFVTSWTAAHQDSLSITNSWSAQTHVHQVGDAIQPSHPLSSPSPPAFSLSQHQGLSQ